MEQPIRYKKVSSRFYSTLRSTIEDFRSGNDQQGLDGFMNTMDDLEAILEMDQYLGTVQLERIEILSILEELCMNIKNQDITGMTDLLEFKLYPIAKELACDDEN